MPGLRVTRLREGAILMDVTTIGRRMAGMIDEFESLPHCSVGATPRDIVAVSVAAFWLSG